MCLFPSDIFLAVAVVIAKAPNSLLSKYVYVYTRNCPDGVLGFYFSTGHNTVISASFIVAWLGKVFSFFVLCNLSSGTRSKSQILSAEVEGTNFALSCASILFQLTRLEIENYNQQIEMETNLEMNQHLQVRKNICS